MSRSAGRPHPYAAPCAAQILTSVCIASGGRRGPVGDSILVGFAQLAPDAAAQDQQTSILTSVERVGHARAGSPTEAIGLVMIASAIAVQRPARTIHCLLLRKHHESRRTPCGSKHPASQRNSHVPGRASRGRLSAPGCAYWIRSSTG